MNRSTSGGGEFTVPAAPSIAGRLFASQEFVSRFPGAVDASEAIRLVGQLLVRGGAVTALHVEAAVARETEHPTGLPAGVPFALVHTDEPGALRLAAALGIFDQPVAFRRMDDESQVLDTRLVIFLAVPDRGSQAEVLGRLVRVFADEATARKLLDLAPHSAYRLLSDAGL